MQELEVTLIREDIFTVLYKTDLEIYENCFLRHYNRVVYKKETGCLIVVALIVNSFASVATDKI